MMHFLQMAIILADFFREPNFEKHPIVIGRVLFLSPSSGL